MMNLLKEMQEQGADIPKTSPVVYCKLFEDNTGGIPLAKAPKINQKYHHFREWVKSGLIEILPIDTREQVADLLTKPLGGAAHRRYAAVLLGHDLLAWPRASISVEESTDPQIFPGGV